MNLYHKNFDSLFKGNSTEVENNELNSLSLKELKDSFNEFSDFQWENAKNEIDPELSARMRDSILTRVSAVESLSTNNTKHSLNIFLRVAAVIALVVSSAIGGYYLSESLRVEQIFEVVADRGQKSSVTLPDGSRVILNSASIITYSSNYNRKNRNISLEGEAYFEVAKNKEIPFVVNANEMNITALGTKFNVKAYSNDNTVTATLVEGKIITEAGEASKIVTPGNFSSYNRSTGEMTLSAVHYKGHIIPWLNNELIFDGESLGEIAKYMERIYNVEIIFSDDSLMDYTYSGLIRNNSLHNVLYLISATSPVQYQIFTNTVKFSKRK